RVGLRIDTDLLGLANTAPQPLDRAAGWSPKPVAMSVREVGVAAPDDPVRTACLENERGFAATDAWTEPPR
ncbi:MAG: urea amidolyase associated protein UAAP1, partial [Solirubrobacteraceae bacterium]